MRYESNLVFSALKAVKHSGVELVFLRIVTIFVPFVRTGMALMVFTLVMISFIYVQLMSLTSLLKEDV